ncbi:MAG: PD-(D/E)XK nuclease family protein [Thermoanaerobaculales bacterium]
MGNVANAAERPRLLVARGARAAEQVVLGRIAELVDLAAADVALLARPVWVVVPSRSLRDHLAATLVRRPRGASAGVAIVTLRQVALAVLEAAGEPAPHGERLFPLLVRWAAASEPALAALVGALQDAHPAVVSTVRDLVDSGFEPGHAEAVLDLLAERGESGGGARSPALARVAAAVATRAAALGLATPASLLRRATELLHLEAERVLPTRAVLVYGFADATGVATDLIEALMRRRDAWVILDEPPDPVDPSMPDLGVRFSQRFSDRLAMVAPREPTASAASPGALPALFAAPGAHAEAREVAQRIRALLDAGVRAEAIGVVARELAPYAPALQMNLSRLGVPFSAPGAAGSADATSRRVLALGELLRRGSEVATDVWLHAAADLGPLDLRVGLHVVGAVRLVDVAALDVERLLGGGGTLPLPVRRGLEELDEEATIEGPSRLVAPRRHLPAATFREAVARAAALVARWESWPDRVVVAVHLRQFRALLARDLGWETANPAAEVVSGAVRELEAGFPVELVLAREEFLTLLRPALATAARTPLGGAGGGVQVLSVTEARGRTFAHLFVLGANRDVFPRTVREDPLLPDVVRGALAVLLPDIPIKRLGFDEERYLFAQLLAAAEHVTISWQSCDDDGNVRPPSPLLERLRLSLGDTLRVSPLISEAPEGLRIPLEQAVLAGLHGSRAHFGGVLAIACTEAAEGLPAGAGEPAALAGARVAVLDELDPDRRTAAGRARATHLGPYFGFIGAPVENADPRREPPFVTRLEEVARCPWQVLLRKLLRLERPPEAARLPELGANLVGALVHAVLAKIVLERMETPPASLEQAITRDPAPVPWPEDAEFERMLAEEALALLRREGLTLGGLARLLAARARPVLLVARDLEWQGREGVPAIAAEVAGSASLPGEPRRIRFIADRVDGTPEGAVLTDYKTGRLLATVTTAAAQRRHLLEAVRGGLRLQAAAYALALDDATGRYVFLRPERKPGQAYEYSVSGDDREVAAAFADAVRATLAAWDAGIFFPRLVNPDGRGTPDACRTCEVREACLQGDSGARRRLFGWATGRERAAGQGGPSAIGAEVALLGVWRLASKGGDAPVGAEEAP